MVNMNFNDDFMIISQIYKIRELNKLTKFRKIAFNLSKIKFDFRRK